jgi:hypothetical protein
LFALACAPLFAQEPTPASQPAATQPTTGPAPKLELSPTELRFGETWQGFPMEREFTVKNTGEGPLTVVVTSSCGCTVVTKPDSPLLPGQSSTFKIGYQTSNLGPVDRRVTVTSNDPARMNVEIPVQGTVKPICEIKPSEHIVFEDVDRDTRESGSVRIESLYTDGPLHMKLKPDQELDRFEVALQELQPGREFELTGTTKPPLEVGWNNATVQVDTGLENTAPVLIYLTARVPPRLEVQPNRLFVTPQFTQPMQFTVRIQYRKREPVNITNMTCDLSTVKYELLPASETAAENRMAYREIRVTVPGFNDIPVKPATLTIFTDAGGEFEKLNVSIERRIPPARRPPRPPSQPTPQPAGADVPPTQK